MRYAVIMAGGIGQRLWPLSRKSRPKQLLSLVDGKSLLDVAVDRLAGTFENENIYIITNAEYVDDIAAALPQLPAENIVGEPMGRDTANAVALAAAILAGKDPEGTMAVFTADHIIRPIEELAQSVETACQTAEADTQTLVTFGIKPTSPHTGLGYVHCAKASEGDIFDVVGFVEKPDHPTARRYVENGNYYWNSGMFVWTIPAIQAAIGEFLPDSKTKLTAITDLVAQGQDYTAAMNEIYPQLEKISIDYAVMEKARKVRMVPLSCEWLDIGSWPAIENVAEPDDLGNAVIASTTVLLDSCRNVIVSEDDHLITLIGMDDCVVVHSPDATLICKKSDSQRLKELLAMIETKSPGKYT
ncbi:MAG: mannose-1-phosphate guanylyltransferase [Phycisphaerales bacterium]|jgi:mannose-1-phosphate guanylyltransferase|nr:mannose-1-phosphate guanylyltransferase [Phycisphaerales bacterium]